MGKKEAASRGLPERCDGVAVRTAALAGWQVAEPSEWVYVWLVDGWVQHVGCTWMELDRRTAEHLHGDTRDPRSSRLRTLVQRSDGPVVVMGVAVPMYRDRRACRDAVVQVLCAEGVVDDGTILPASSQCVRDSADAQWVRQVVREVLRELRPGR